MDEFKLGCILPMRTRKVGGWFFTQQNDGTIQATLSLDAYYDPANAAQILPESTDWSAKAMASIKRIYKNNQWGCCVISSAFHQLGLWSGNDAGIALEGTDNEVMAAYRIWNPGNRDNGCNIPTVLNYTRDHGMMIGGVLRKIDSYVSVDNTNKDLVKAATILFGTIKLGIDLPNAWRQASEGGIWDVTNSGIVGGHDVPTIAYNQQGVPIATWGGVRTMTWNAFASNRYIKEAYCPLSPDWYGQDRIAPNGIDATTLKADLNAIANGQIPSVGPPLVPFDWLI